MFSEAKICDLLFYCKRRKQINSCKSEGESIRLFQVRSEQLIAGSIIVQPQSRCDSFMYQSTIRPQILGIKMGHLSKTYNGEIFEARISFRKQIRRKYLDKYFRTKRHQFFSEYLTGKAQFIHNQILEKVAQSDGNQVAIKWAEEQLDKLFQKFPHHPKNFVILGAIILKSSSIEKYFDGIFSSANLHLSRVKKFVWLIGIYISKVSSENCLFYVEKFLLQLMAHYFSEWNFQQSHLCFENYCQNVLLLLYSKTSQFFPIKSAYFMICASAKIYKQQSNTKLAQVVRQILIALEKRQIVFSHSEKFSLKNITRIGPQVLDSIRILLNTGFQDELSKKVLQSQTPWIEVMERFCFLYPDIASQYILTEQNFKSFTFHLLNRKSRVAVLILNILLHLFPNLTSVQIASLFHNYKFYQTLVIGFQQIEPQNSQRILNTIKLIRTFLEKLKTLDNDLFQLTFSRMSQLGLKNYLDAILCLISQESLENYLLDFFDDFFFDEIVQNQSDDEELLQMFQLLEIKDKKSYQSNLQSLESRRNRK